MTTAPISPVTGFNQLKHMLIEDGFCIVPGVLGKSDLVKIRATSNRLVAAMTDEDRRHNTSTGSMIGVGSDPAYAGLIALPAALDVLTSLGYPEPKFTSGYVISKPPGSPRLFWHYDWPAWDDPAALGDVPQQLFLMYYLTDTRPENGCLRVIPGSHKNYHPLLDSIAEAHSAAVSEAHNLNRPEFQHAAGEVDVCVAAGDLVIGDSRLLHASHANQSAEHRTVITLWYHPDLAALPESTQAFVAGMWFNPTHWPGESRALVEPLRPNYRGDAAPLPWNRTRAGAKS